MIDFNSEFVRKAACLYAVMIIIDGIKCLRSMRILRIKLSQS